MNNLIQKVIINFRNVSLLPKNNGSFLFGLKKYYKISRDHNLKDFLKYLEMKISKKNLEYPKQKKFLNEQTNKYTNSKSKASMTQKNNSSILNQNFEIDVAGIPKDLSGKKVLDIGCRDGSISFECEKRGAKVIGIEPNPRLQNLGIKKRNETSSFTLFLRMYEDDINHLNYQFDIILLSSLHVIENQLDMLKKIYEKLERGGLSIFFLKLSGKNEGENFIEEKEFPDSKTRRFPNKFTITKLLKDAGFQDVNFYGKVEIFEEKTPRTIVHATKGVTISEIMNKPPTMKPKKIRNYQTFSEDHKGGSDSILKLKILEIPQNLNGKNVLDLGCNEGFFSFECENRGASVVGIEKRPYWYQAALKRKEELKSSVNFQNLSWDDIDNLDSNFDLILFLAAFHYARGNKLDLLKKIFKKMNPGGLLILDAGLTDKNEGTFFIDKLVRKKTGELVEFPNKFTIEKLLKDAGFTSILFYGESNIMKDLVPRFVIHANKKP